MPGVGLIDRVVRQIVSDSLEIPDPRAARGRMLELLGTVAPFESAIFLCGPRLSGPPVSINKDRAEHFHRLYVQGRDRYTTELKHARVAAQAQGGVYLDTAVYSAAERGRLGFFQEIIRPQGITSQLALHLRFRGELVGAIHLCRHRGAGAFRARDRDKVAQLVRAVTLAHIAASGLSPAEPLHDYTSALSKREREIARYVMQGLRTREIAAALGTSPHTVRNQLQHLYEKTDTGGRTELALLMSRGPARPLGSE